jgi:hypothetical protein
VPLEREVEREAPAGELHDLHRGGGDLRADAVPGQDNDAHPRIVSKRYGINPFMSEAKWRDLLVARGRSLYDRGYAHGSSGNLSTRVDGGILITPTGSSLGRLEPEKISKVDDSGRHISGDPPSKESFLHLAMYAERPGARGIVHLHCTCAVGRFLPRP